MNNKINELRAIVVKEMPDVVALTETWTNESIDNCYLGIDGYEILVRSDRVDTVGGRGGGIMVYVKEIVALKEEEGTDFNQCTTVKVKRRGHDLGISIVCRSPNLDIENDTKLCQWIRSMRGENVIIGDFNFPGVRWESGCCDSRGRLFYEACSDVFLTQHVEEATHLSGNTLNLVLSSDPSLVRGVEMIGRIGASDHETLLVDIPLDVLTRRASYSLRNFNRANFGEMRRELSIDWEVALSGLNVESMWASIKSKINGAIEKHVPLRRIGLNRKPKWLNHKILMLIGKKRKAWSRWKECRSAENEREYKNLEKLVKRRIRNSKNNTERRVAKEAKENPKAFFSYVNSSKETRVKIGPLKDKSGNIVTDPLEQAGILNAHYATVFTRSVTELPAVESITEEVIDDVDVSVERVKNTIDELKEISAPGPDNIGNKVIMELKEQLALPFSILFRKSLDDAEVPEEWKDSVVSPIFKKGARSDPGNYRPVSQTCNTCKLLEKIIKGEIESHMERHVTGNSQHGFRRGRSPRPI